MLKGAAVTEAKEGMKWT